jgi:hypothetical protein
MLRHMKITFYNQLTMFECEELSAPSRNQAREAPLVDCPEFFFSLFTSIAVFGCFLLYHEMLTMPW